MELDGVVAVGWCRSVSKMCVVGNVFVFVVISVRLGVVLCCVLL